MITSIVVLRLLSPFAPFIVVFRSVYCRLSLRESAPAQPTVAEQQATLFWRSKRPQIPNIPLLAVLCRSQQSIKRRLGLILRRGNILAC